MNLSLIWESIQKDRPFYEVIGLWIIFITTLLVISINRRFKNKNRNFQNKEAIRKEKNMDIEKMNNADHLYWNEKSISPKSIFETLVALGEKSNQINRSSDYSKFAQDKAYGDFQKLAQGANLLLKSAYKFDWKNTYIPETDGTFIQYLNFLCNDDLLITAIFK